MLFSLERLFGDPYLSQVARALLFLDALGVAVFLFFPPDPGPRFLGFSFLPLFRVTGSMRRYSVTR